MWGTSTCEVYSGVYRARVTIHEPGTCGVKRRPSLGDPGPPAGAGSTRWRTGSTARPCTDDQFRTAALDYASLDAVQRTTSGRGILAGLSARRGAAACHAGSAIRPGGVERRDGTESALGGRWAPSGRTLHPWYVGGPGTFAVTCGRKCLLQRAGCPERAGALPAKSGLSCVRTWQSVPAVRRSNPDMNVDVVLPLRQIFSPIVCARNPRMKRLR